MPAEASAIFRGMERNGFAEFCGSTLWNETFLLDNAWPQFTDCFMHTVLIWVPCAFFWLSLPMYFSSTNGRDTKASSQMTLFSFLRLLCCVMLVFLTLVQLLLRTEEKATNRSMAAFLGDGLQMVTYFFCGVLTQHERIKGGQPTGWPFFFWLLTSLGSIVPLYSMIIVKQYENSIGSFAVFVLSYAVQLSALALTFFTDDADSGRANLLEKPPCPETTCSFPSRLFFWWMMGLLKTGYKRDITEQDMWSLPVPVQARTQVSRFEQLWKEEQIKCDIRNRTCINGGSEMTGNNVTMKARMNEGIDNSLNVTESSFLLQNHTRGDSKTFPRFPVKDGKSTRRTPSLMRILAKMYAKDFCISFLLKCISDFTLILGPLILGVFLRFLDEKPEGRDWQGYVLCVGMYLCILIKAQFFGHCMFSAERIGMKTKSTLIAAVYKKALTISNASRNTSTVGSIVTLMSVDAQRILDLMQTFFFAASTPIQLIVIIGLLYSTIGPSIFAGALVLVSLVPVNTYLVFKHNKLQKNSLACKDARVKLYNEILKGIKVLKLYAWEPSFREKIRDIRLKEIEILFQIAVRNTLMSLGWDMATYLMTLVTFATYVMTDENPSLDAGKAFMVLSFFNVLQAPISAISSLIMYTVQALVSVRRINKFLVKEDLNLLSVHRDSSADKAISITNASFSWNDISNPALSSINLDVGEGKLVAVVGPVGSGKTSLISAILGEMEKRTGTVTLKGSVAFVPQQAWIQNATLRDNILFGKPYIQSKYTRTLKQCELEHDLSILHAGDMTEIGEKGINLSGGQKQRVSLARAVYNDADVYLLDDPLSAVDSHVGKALFQKVIGPTGVLKRKTRVLVTHGVHWLPMVDEIIVMTDGKISERGSYEQLLSHKGPFAQFLLTHLAEIADSDDEDDPEKIREQMRKRMGNVTSKALSSREKFLRDINLLRRNSKRKVSELECSITESITRGNEESIPEFASGKLTTMETIESGKVSKEVYYIYARTAGLLFVTLAFLSYCFFQSFSVGANFWLKAWTASQGRLNGTTGNATQNASFYLGIYGVFGICQAVCLLTFNYLYWTRVTVAAREMHARLADRLLRAPMSFFDTTPIGRILNRVSRDVETVDNKLPLIIRDFIVDGAMFTVSILVITIQTPLFSVILLPLMVLYYIFQTFYVRTTRQLRRIESVTRSPIYVLFSETLSGASSIRAYGATQRFLDESLDRVDKNQVYYFAFQGAVRWLQWNLDILAGMVVFTASLFAMLNTDSAAGDAGLSVSYALQVSLIITWMTRQFTEFKTNIVSVERMKEYSELKTEADWIVPHYRPPTFWPAKGEVIFNDYKTRYRDGMDLVLKGINFTIKPGEKVGIVGRTGAGKSSLTLSLFRLIESAGGYIEIDGVNIADIGLHDLRTHLTILPQEPLLFSDTLRANLDPFKEYTDGELWLALDRAHLKAAVDQMLGGLEFQCGEEGGNLSVGQRQLVCLGRALLRKSKIVVLDEATAAVDMETDALIQNTIRTAFNECTVITIAHRLNTIMDCDRIMVMDSGLIKEFAPPDVLLADRTSSFYLMAKAAGMV